MEDSRRLASICVPWSSLLPLHEPKVASRTDPPSPLMLSDRLLTLAQEAERAGCVGVAQGLLALAHAVLDPPEDVYVRLPS